MVCTGKLEDISLDYITRKPKVTLLLNENINIDELKDVEKLSIEIKKFRNKRSLDANGYFWSLCNKLAQKLNIPPQEVYREHIKELGICKQFTLGQDEANTFKTAWGMLGLGWLCEQLDITSDNKVLLNAYYGSSTYNTKQMARLIDNIVQDCKEQGIDVLNETELLSLVKEWDK